MGDGHSLDFLFFSELHLQCQIRSDFNGTLIFLIKSREGQKSGSDRLKNFMLISPHNVCSDILNRETFTKETLQRFSLSKHYSFTTHNPCKIFKISPSQKFICSENEF